MKVKGILCTLFIFLFAGCQQEIQRKEQPATHRNLVKLLRPLDPLQKPHYSWALPTDVLDSSELLSEFIRITHGASISGAWGTESQVQALAPHLRSHNAKLAINYSPLHRSFPSTGELLDLLPDVQRVTQEFRTDMLNVKSWADAADVEVGALLLDSERFRVKEDNDLHNDTLDQTYNNFYDICKEIFPLAPVVWYNRGAVYPSSSSTGWTQDSAFTLREKGDSYSCTLYHGPEIYAHRLTVHKTHDRVQDFGVNPIVLVPWISLGSGYIPQVDTMHRWNFNWDYDVIYSWKMGAEINHPWFGVPERHERYAPYDSVPMVVFYPEPFGRTKNWGKYFVSYVRGAQLIRELP